MDALSHVENAGFDVAMVDGFIEISPASALTMQQREFLKSHKAEIINELKKRQSVIKPPLIKCRDCLNFECFNAYGKGAGHCLIDGDYGLWSETLHECNKFDACVEWVFYDEPQGETVTCYTPNGKAIEVKANSPEHAVWLLKMNPNQTEKIT